MRIKRGPWLKMHAGLVAGLTCMAGAGLWALSATADAAPAPRPVTVAPDEPDVPHNMPGAVRGDGEDIVVSPGKIPDGCSVEISQSGDVGPKGSYRQTVILEVCQPDRQEDAPAGGEDATESESETVSSAPTAGDK